jgi:hypothetical protein
LQKFAQAGAVIAVLPDFALDRFGDCLFRSALGSMEPLTEAPGGTTTPRSKGP